MKFDLIITIRLKEGMLNPEAEAIRHAIAHLGFPTEKLVTADQFTITIEAENKAAAEEIGISLCEKLLANPVIHTYEIEVR
ncbi:MAG: phosphoribosylformylglycinamidine synthase, purS protein [Methanocalculus sp. MSAO_Arc1]|uniref:phosphoribosylformylglycinamidine synthase subunit PurS n=1 Tax=Methanocalculus TaxID=71151 RepID=UPI000FF5BFF2|nr:MULTISPECIES: phosphoribosylformylglycinamidine synthase subunit PurS [unclassified Methanocalculus]MCP1662945.1 phosphoribosylformylglycinamidine synthase [Methanocalculus sp. AMF5]RQD81469.1 MAG: phosphoribosylformylglycinamidine synthase, purS protein [Methanocalculus sp. MSAO_Arc1]